MARTKVKLPLITSQHVTDFSGATITKQAGTLINGVVDAYDNDPERKYVTQRPSVVVFEDASDNSTRTKGRGIYYWTKANSGAGARYIVNDDKVYKSEYSVEVVPWTNGDTESNGLTSGTEKVYFVEWSSSNDDYLFIINPESNQVFFILASNDDELVNVKDVIDDATTSGHGLSGTLDIDGLGNPGDTYDFTALPVTSTAGGTNDMCHGTAVLDQYWFLGTKNDAKIWNCALNNFLDWSSALKFITCERENDRLFYIDKIGDHILGFGGRTVEVFYDAANSVGSPLSTRNDIIHNIGILSGEAAWRTGDHIFFLAMTPTGDIGLRAISHEMQLMEASSSTLNSYFKHGRVQASLVPVVCGMSSGGHTYVFVTIFNSSRVPQVTLVYDMYSKLWYRWTTSLASNTHMPIVSWTVRTPDTPVTAEGILVSGDLVYFGDDFSPVDTTASTGYFAEEYGSETGASAYSAADAVVPETANVPMQIIISNFDGGTNSTKFMHFLEYIGTQTQDSQTLTVEWSDNSGESFDYSASIDLSDRTQINRLGRFNSRDFRLSYSGDEQIFAEALEATVSV